MFPAFVVLYAINSGGNVLMIDEIWITLTVQPFFYGQVVKCAKLVENKAGKETELDGNAKERKALVA